MTRTDVKDLVLNSTRRVVDHGQVVHINLDRIEPFAKRIAPNFERAPAWNLDFHYSGEPGNMVQWVFVLDALNFSFWPDEGEKPWRVPWRGGMVKGYWALAWSLKRAMQTGVPITDAVFLEGMDDATLSKILNGEGSVPMLKDRVANLKEVGRVLRQRYDGLFLNILNEAGRSVARTISIITSNFPSFYDVAIFEGEGVYFFKRAQILISDLWGACGGAGFGEFDDLSILTAFADYKLPQLLRALGILEYTPSLAKKVDNLVELPAGSREELEIRATTIWAVEEIRRVLLARGCEVDAYVIDWHLWDLSHNSEYEQLPHHRTRTIFY